MNTERLILEKHKHFNGTEIPHKPYCSKITEGFKFGKAETVGAIRIWEVFPDKKHFPGWDMVLLDFGRLDILDNSNEIYRVPSGFFTEDQVVEVIAKKSIARSSNGITLVAIRSFEKQTFGKPIAGSEKNLKEMFRYNYKDIIWSEMFYKKFFNH